MARINKKQKAGLDLLDQIVFNELLVYRGMNFEEQQQIGTITKRVTQMAESKYSGRDAEIIKHVAYCFLEVSLINTREESEKAVPVKLSPIDLPPETLDAADAHKKTLQMASMLAFTEMSTGFNASYALEISESLKNEFVGYSALVRRDLPRRCCVYEFGEASLRSYCWLTVSGVLPVTKNGAARIDSNFDEKFLIRLALIADYEMILHHWKMRLSSHNPAFVFLGQSKFDLKEATIDRLLDVDSAFRASRAKSSLRGVPLITLCDMRDAVEVQNFFELWGSRTARFRMHSGSLASWLGFLGASMVEMQFARETRDATQERSKSGTNLKISPIYNACDNQDAITESVKQRLSEYGLQINSDTLYRTHSKMRNNVLQLLDTYCNVTRDLGVVTSVMEADTFYMSVFIHKDSMPI